MSWRDQDWVTTVSVLLKIGFVVALAYLGLVYLERSSRKPLVREERQTVDIHDDLLVYAKKANVNSLESARRTLFGKPLWVKEGYRWAYQPGDQLFEPIEKIVPTRVYESGGQARLAFQNGGKEYSFAISGGGRFFVDEVFFIEDPRELYSHWSEEDWAKIEAHEVEPGMSEFQIVFARGFGQTVEQNSTGSFRVVEYEGGADDGLDPVRVTYRNGVAEEIERIALDS